MVSYCLKKKNREQKTTSCKDKKRKNNDFNKVCSA